MQLAAVCVFGLIVEEVSAQVGEDLLELSRLVLPLWLSLIVDIADRKRGNSGTLMFEWTFSHG